MIIASVVIYRAMPAEVPLHWGSDGQVDRYGPRAQGAFGLPSAALGLYIIMSSVVKFYQNVSPSGSHERIANISTLLLSLEILIFGSIWVYQVIRTFGR